MGDRAQPELVALDGELMAAQPAQAEAEHEYACREHQDETDGHAYLLERGVRSVTSSEPDLAGRGALLHVRATGASTRTSYFRLVATPQATILIGHPRNSFECWPVAQLQAIQVEAAGARRGFPR